MFFSVKNRSKNITTKQSSLKSRTISVIKWDRYNIKQDSKNSVSVLKSGNNSKKDTVISILPSLRARESGTRGRVDKVGVASFPARDVPKAPEQVCA